MIRADLFLSQNGYVKSRQNAKALIEGGKVMIDGKEVKKASELLDETAIHSVEVVRDKYVCRGAYKLEGALDAFRFSPAGLRCIDIGASTGGFTDVLLQRNASVVYAVDSGHGQLDGVLAADERVVNIEGYNARNLKRSDFPFLFQLAVMDVSFISQTYIHCGVVNVLDDDGILISLIKPQFEAGRGAVGKNGIVKRKEDREAAVLRVLNGAKEAGLFCKNIIRSPIDGGDGNIEYLALFSKNSEDMNVTTKDIKELTRDERRL